MHFTLLRFECRATATVRFGFGTFPRPDLDSASMERADLPKMVRNAQPAPLEKDLLDVYKRQLL